MPYIEKDEREDLEKFSGACGVGELTFEVTSLVSDYLERRCAVTEAPLRFQMIADVIAALEATKLEMYRRIVSPFEECKRLTNGDVYPEALRRKAGAS